MLLSTKKPGLLKPKLSKTIYFANIPFSFSNGPFKPVKTIGSFVEYGYDVLLTLSIKVNLPETSIDDGVKRLCPGKKITICAEGDTTIDVSHHHLKLVVFEGSLITIAFGPELMPVCSYQVANGELTISQFLDLLE